jgi:hypothetical protein
MGIMSTAHNYQFTFDGDKVTSKIKRVVSRVKWQPRGSVEQEAAMSITIRPATAEDQRALARLAALDERPLPSGEVLLAFVDGELRAAFGAPSGLAVADPFEPTADVVELLRLRSEQETASRKRWAA